MRILASSLVLAALSCRPAGPFPTENEREKAAPTFERVRHEVQADGHPIAVWEKTASDPRRTIVLLHGRTWSSIPDFDLQVPGEQRSLMDVLAAKGYQTYAVDLRGYGETPRDETGWLTLERAAADLAIVLEWIGKHDQSLTPPVMLGWSMGSVVSLLCAQRHPDKLSDLILYGFPRDVEVEIPDLTAPVERETEGDTEAEPPPAQPSEPAREPNTAENAASDFITPEVISERAIQEYVRASLAADPVRVDWRDLHEFNAIEPSRVTVPTLVLHGERDPIATVDKQTKLFAALGHADRRWVIIPGGDHAAHIEDTMPLFVAAVVSFIERPK